MKLKHLILVITIGLTSLVACKKTPNDEPKPDPVATRADLTRDSIFLYAKEMYLWNTALPTYEAFNPRKYNTLTKDFDNYEQELIALANIAKNPATGLAYEYFANGADSKYSYITDIADKNPVAFVPTKQSAVDLEGNGNDFGIKLGAYGQGGTTFALFITAVYQNSPADKAGVIRSDRIYKINGRTIGDNYTNDRDFINTAFSGTTITLEGVHYLNGVSDAAYTLNLVKASYKSNPVYAAKVFTAGAKKVGYLAYARFSTLSNSKPEFDAAFANFNTNGVTDLILDLRYNGGGYVNTAQYLINQIAPSTLNGKFMYSETYNTTMQSGQARILANQPFLDANDKVQYSNGRMVTYLDLDYSIAGNTENFVKAGPLTNLKKLYVIVSGNTASASELVINSLKAYPSDIEVILIGTNTYGKPVGFFPIKLENKYEVYYSLFQTKNALGQGDYFAGFTPNVVDDFDDPRNNFGDPKEYYTSLALNRIAPGAIVTSSLAKTMSIQGRSVAVESLQKMKPLVDGNEFVGMIETNHKVKK